MSSPFGAALPWGADVPWGAVVTEENGTFITANIQEAGDQVSATIELVPTTPILITGIIQEAGDTIKARIGEQESGVFLISELVSDLTSSLTGSLVG